MMRMKTIALLAVASLAAGCGDGGVGEIRTWMKQVEKETVPQVKPLPEPKTFEPYGYHAREAPDPFSPVKLLGDVTVAQPDNANAPDVNRPKEVMENFPLDTMRMVGTMKKAGVTYALLQVERTLYRVRPGQRIGQNFGRITRVSEEAVEIRETVQDATGDWVERMAQIELQHNKESSK